MNHVFGDVVVVPSTPTNCVVSPGAILPNQVPHSIAVSAVAPAIVLPSQLARLPSEYITFTAVFRGNYGPQEFKHQVLFGYGVAYMKLEKLIV